MLKKICAINGCGILCDIGQTYCEKHQKQFEKQEKERYKEYKQRRQDKKEQEFYTSKQWILTRKNLLEKYNFMDVYEFIMNNRIIPADVVHHIITLKENWSLRLNESNLIPLSNGSHKIIHILYLKDYETYQTTIRILKQAKEEFNKFKS